MFTKNERSSFPYWFAHWCAFQMTALNLHCWKFKYLFHDFEKPWLRLFMPYEKVQKIHRRNNKHHAEYKGGLNNVDWEALIIDNECSRFTKESAKMTAREWIEFKVKNSQDERIVNAFKTYALPLLKKMNL